MSERDLDSDYGRLEWARARVFPSAADMARAVGLHPTSYRAYENGQNGFAKHAALFAKALGVTAEWLLEGGPAPEGEPVVPLPMEPPSNARVFQMEGPSSARMDEDVPVYGTALGASMVLEGEAIEQTTLNTGEVVAYFKRPVVLSGRSDIYGVFVIGSSMEPRYEEGEAVFVETRRPAKIGDDVLVYLAMPEGEGERDASVMIKRLVRRTASYVELRQFNPPVTFKVDAARVSKMHRVLTLSELIS